MTLLYFDGCSNWQLTHTRLIEALRATGHPDQPVTLRTVTTPEQADPFTDRNAPVGPSCRMFTTPAGHAGLRPSRRFTAVLT